MSDIKRTVEQLMLSPEYRSRSFAIDVMMKSAHVFDPVDLTKRLELASLDAHPDVAKKAKLSMSMLLKEGFQEAQRIRALGIDSRLMNVSEAEMQVEQGIRERAASLLAPTMARVIELARQGAHPLCASALKILGLTRNLNHANELILATQDLQRRKAAFDALSLFRIPETADLVANLLDSATDNEDLVALIDVLGELNLEETAPHLVELTRHTDDTVRERATVAIGKAGGEGAEAALLRRLEDKNPVVQRSAITAMAKAGRASASTALVDLYDKLRAPETQAASLATFARIKSQRALPRILAATTSTHPVVRAAAAEALSRFKIKPEEVSAHLLPLTNDADAAVRAAAVKTLYPYDASRAGNVLRAMLGSKKVAERGAAMAIMGDVQDPQAMEEFLVAVNTEQDKTILAGGLGALDKIADPRLKKGIHRLLSHPNPNVKIKAVRAYGRIAGTAGIKDLDRLYDEVESEVVRSAILSTLGEMCEAGNISYLTRRLKEPDERIVANAIEALDRVGSIENTTLLESLLSHPSPRVRANVVVALFHTGNFRCLSVLTDMLGRSDEAAQRSALYALEQLLASLRYQEVQRRPLLMTPLMQPEAQGTGSAVPGGSVANLERPLTAGSMNIPRPTTKVAIDRSTPEERDLVRATLAAADAGAHAAREPLDRVLASQPENELALFLNARIATAQAPAAAVPEAVLAKSTFLPLLSEEATRAKSTRDVRRLTEAYFRIFERQLEIMRATIEEGRDYIARDAPAQALEVVKFIVTQMQWTVDFDLRLGQIAYDKQHWEPAFNHLMRAFLSSGGDGSVGVYLAAVAMKLRKLELSKIILTSILNSEITDPKVRERAVQVAQALAQVEQGKLNPTV